MPKPPISWGEWDSTWTICLLGHRFTKCAKPNRIEPPDNSFPIFREQKGGTDPWQQNNGCVGHLILFSFPPRANNDKFSKHALLDHLREIWDLDFLRYTLPCIHCPLLVSASLISPNIPYVRWVSVPELFLLEGHAAYHNGILHSLAVQTKRN